MSSGQSNEDVHDLLGKCWRAAHGSVIYYYYYICYYLFYCTSCIFSKKDERKLLKSEFKLILFVYRITHSPQKALTTGWGAKRFGADIHGLWLKMWFSGICCTTRRSPCQHISTPNSTLNGTHSSVFVSFCVGFWLLTRKGSVKF